MAARLILKPAVAADSSAIEDARAAGWGEAEIAALEERIGSAPERDFSGLWPEHVMPCRALTAAMTQWRTMLTATDKGLRNRIAGLDYAAAAIAWERLGIVLDAAGFAALQVLERASVAILNGEEVA